MERECAGNRSPVISDWLKDVEPSQRHRKVKYSVLYVLPSTDKVGRQAIASPYSAEKVSTVAAFIHYYNYHYVLLTAIATIILGQDGSINHY